MIVFAQLVASAVTVLLCAFLANSHTPFGTVSPKKYAGILAGSWAVFSAAVLIWDTVFLPAVLAAGIAGILCRCVGQADWKRAVFFGIAFGILRLAASGTALLCTHFFLAANAQCTLLIEILSLYAMAVFASLFNEQWSRAPGPLLQLVPIWLVAVVLSSEAIRNHGHREVVILEAIAYIWILYAGIHLIPTGKRMEAGIQKFMRSQEKARHYVLREEYYQQLREKQTETRALWHDLNKYLRAAKTEASSAQALEQLEAMLDSATEIVDVGNQVLNVILNEYAQAAKAAGIELRLRVQVPPKLAVSVADLYILIGNTMDNALEACGALPTGQRVIDMTLRTHNDVVYYKLMNPYAHDHAKRAPEPMRGHGLSNVRRCVEKYGGVVDIIDENEFFTVTAHLNVDSFGLTE